MKINSQTPFTTRTQIAAQGIHGSFDQRNMSINGPLKEVSDDMQLYNTILGDPSKVKAPVPVTNGADIIAQSSLPQVNAQSSNTSNPSFEQPAAIVDPNKGAKPEYSFLDNTGGGLTDYSANLRNDPNRSNFFGTHKRNEQSIQSRIDEADNQGKTAKKARLERKMDNFKNNQARREDPSSDTFVNPATGASEDKGTKIGNFLKSIF